MASLKDRFIIILIDLVGHAINPIETLNWAIDMAEFLPTLHELNHNNRADIGLVFAHSKTRHRQKNGEVKRLVNKKRGLAPGLTTHIH